MLKMRSMTPEQFIASYEKGYEGRLKELCERIKEAKHVERLDYSGNPIYKTENGIFGAGDCWYALSYREGWGYTMFWIGDRGSWHCSIPSQDSKWDDIVFLDGAFEEVVEYFVNKSYL